MRASTCARFLPLCSGSVSAHLLDTGGVPACGPMGALLYRYKLITYWCPFVVCRELQGAYIARGGLDPEWKPLVFGVEAH